MFVSLAGYAVDMRPLRVHVPAFLRATSQVWTVSLKAGLYTYKAVERARRVDRRRETQWLAYLSDVYLRAGRLMTHTPWPSGCWRSAVNGVSEALRPEVGTSSARSLYSVSPRMPRKRSPLPSGPRPSRGTRPALAPGALPPWPWHQTGQRQQAHAALSAAIGLYRAMDMTFWLPQAQAALAQVEGRQGVKSSQANCRIIS